MNNKSITLAVFVLFAAVSAGLMAEPVEVRVMDLRAETGLSDAVVEVLLPAGTEQAARPVQVSVDQVDKEFISDVTLVPVGSQVNFPNSDNILHHVYSFSRAKSFDIPLYGAGDNLDRFEQFDKPGVVAIGCNIHDWMLAYIYVAGSGQAAKTDASGLATLENLAPGHYQIKIWHARMGDDKPLFRDVEVVAGAETSLTVSLELAPERRIRRAPSASGGRYR